MKKLSFFISTLLFPVVAIAECTTQLERGKAAIRMNDAEQIEFYLSHLSDAGKQEYNKKMSTSFSDKTSCVGAEESVAPNDWKSKTAKDCWGALISMGICLKDNPDKKPESKPAPTTEKNYKITYMLDGGKLDDQTGSVTQTCKDGETISLKAAPTKNGNDFAGWKYPNGTVVEAGFTGVTCGDYTITAQWKSTDTTSVSSKDFRRKECENSGGSYIAAGTVSDIDDNCSCPNGMIVTSGSIGKYLSVKSCSKCSDGWEPDPDKQNKMCREKSAPSDESEPVTSDEEKPKRLSDMAETDDEKKLVSEFEALNKKFDDKVKQLKSAN